MFINEGKIYHQQKQLWQELSTLQEDAERGTGTDKENEVKN